MPNFSRGIALAILIVTSGVGCSGNPFLSLPVGPTQTQNQVVSELRAPAATKRGSEVQVVLKVWFPGGKCWQHERVETNVDDINKKVTFKPTMTYTPIIADTHYGRGCLDGTEEIKVSFTPRDIGRYSLEAPSFQSALPATAAVEVSE